jgi:hypothetical protein
MDRRDSLLWQSSGMLPGSHGGLLEELRKPDEEMTRKPKGRQGNRGAKQGAEIFVDNVTTRYILAIQDLPKKQQNHVH